MFLDWSVLTYRGDDLLEGRFGPVSDLTVRWTALHGGQFQTVTGSGSGRRIIWYSCCFDFAGVHLKHPDSSNGAMRGIQLGPMH